jgi:hypothetical protein
LNLHDTRVGIYVINPAEQKIVVDIFEKFISLGSLKALEKYCEVRVINAIKEMQSQGMTLRQIATILSQVGVPTKQRGQAWYPEMVRFFE